MIEMLIGIFVLFGLVYLLELWFKLPKYVKIYALEETSHGFQGTRTHQTEKCEAFLLTFRGKSVNKLSILNDNCDLKLFFSDGTFLLLETNGLRRLSDTGIDLKQFTFFKCYLEIKLRGGIHGFLTLRFQSDNTKFYDVCFDVDLFTDYHCRLYNGKL